MKKIVFILLVLFSFSCANKVPPSGGEKDIDPPVLIKSTPEMNKTHFKGREFTLEFDELFDLESIYTQLVISPPLKTKEKVKTNRNKLTVSFYEENLKENTTYSFNFGNAIKDHNEGNILKNFSYVFSTGDYIDSLFISGKVVDSYSNEPIENVAVMIYESHEDSMPLTSPPSYFDITEEDGTFKIANIKDGIYKVFALEDLNQNYIYDQPSERVGFLFELLEIEADSVYNYEIPIFQEDNKQQFVSSVVQEPYGFVTVVMNRPFGNFEFKIHNRDDNELGFKHKLWPGRDTLQFWFPDYKEDFILEVFDDSDFSDSIDISIEPVFELEEVPVFTIKTNVKGKVDIGKPLVLRIAHPLETWNFSLIKLWEDSVEVPIEPYILDSTKLRVRVDYEWKEGKKYNLIVGLGAFVDMYDQKNDVFEVKFGSQEESYYGVINLSVNLFEKQWPYILEIFNSEKKTIKTHLIYKSSEINYVQLQPGDYGFRIIEDVNENGKWDPGNYELGFLPENIYYFNEMINVRSNWELDYTWNLNTSK